MYAVYSGVYIYILYGIPGRKYCVYVMKMAQCTILFIGSLTPGQTANNFSSRPPPPDIVVLCIHTIHL